MKKILEGTERVITLFQSGLTQTQVASAIGKSQHYVSKRLLAAGVSRAKKDTYAIKLKGKPPLSPKKEIVDLYASGLSSGEIACRLGISHVTVMQHAKAAGIARTRWESLHDKSMRGVPTIRQAPSGYLVFSRGGEDYFVHRAVMESHLGRKLGSKEVVHHKDEDILNNAIENLEVLTVADHARHHMKIEKPPCAICGRPSRNRTLCALHYQQAYRDGSNKKYPLVGGRWKSRNS